MQFQETNEAVVAFSAEVDVLSDINGDFTKAQPHSDPFLNSHKVHNFEVEGTHTYIADGMRVHNTSVLSFLDDNQLANLSFVDDSDGDGDLDFAVVSIPGSATEIEVTSGEVGASETARFEIVTADENGNLIRITFDKDADGKVIPGSERQEFLSGQHVGAAIGGALTPFLTAAFLDDDASVFDQVAADTIIGTILENLGEVAGGFANVVATNEDRFKVGENLDVVVTRSFEDFGGELVVNAVDTSISVVNQLIMAEIFESLELDGVSGAVFDTIVGTGLNSLLTSGADYLLETDFFQELFTDLGFSQQSLRTIQDYSGATFPTDIAGFTTVLISKLLNEFLPAIETIEGQIASAVTNAALAALQIFDDLILAGVQLGGPIGIVIGWVVGKLFDSLFEQEPEAWSNVGFDAESGRFVLLGTWEHDGGNTQLSVDLAQAYLDGMNGFVESIEAQSHNFDQLGQWTFGHFEESLKNAGKYGQTFGDFQATYVNALITDMSNADVLDGRMAAVRVLEQGIEGEQLRHIVNDYKFYENFETILGAVRDATDINDIDLTTLRLDFEETLIVYGSSYGSTYNSQRDLSRTAGPELGDYVNFREFLKAWHDYLDPIRYVTYRRAGGESDEWDQRTAQSPEAAALQVRLQQILALNDFQTLEEFVRPENYRFDQYSVENLNAFADKYSALSHITDGISLVNSADHASLDHLSLNFSETLIVYGSSYGSTYNRQRDLSRTAGPELGDYVNFREFLKAWHDYLDPIRYVTYRRAGGESDEWDQRTAQSSEATALQGQIGLLLQLNFLTLEDFLIVASPIRLPAPPFLIDNVQAYNTLSTNLQIASDFHTYLDNSAAIDDIIALDSNSVLAAGWVATLLAAEEMGLNDAYDLTGDSIDNLFYTANGDDTVNGVDGNDTITTYGGSDSISGGNGNDSIKSGGGSDTIYGGEGDDNLDAGSGDDLVWGGSGADLAYLGDGNDVFRDTQDDYGDTVWAGQGDDTVDGRGGDDLFGGREGNDSILGGGGNDTLWGGDGNDTVIGGSGNDQLGGGTGADSLEGGFGEDELWGGAGADSLWAGRGDDTVNAGNGNDQLAGKKGNDYLTGGGGADVFIYYDVYSSGDDIISDFDTDLDLIEIEGVEFADLTISQVTQDVRIEWGHSTITLVDNEIENVTSDVFIFV